jgi:type 1 glutamine amidotransferase
MTIKKFILTFFVALTTLVSASSIADAQKGPKPLRVLLVIGGCCHDYATQKDLLKVGIESRLNATVDIAYDGTKTTKPLFEAYNGKDWAKGYDVVIHDECAADITDPVYVENILQAHRNGTPAVNLHCAMHSYRWGNYKEAITAGSDNSHWYEMIGLQSTGHGPKLAVEIKFTDHTHPITTGLNDWTTFTNEELYNNIKFLGAQGLAEGTQLVKDKTTGVENVVKNTVVWTNLYGPNQTRIFSTTLGHDNKTVGDDRYLDLVTRGILWATNKISADGQPQAGYGAKK